MKTDMPIIYEDDFLLAINKPARLASVPGKEIPLHQTALGLAQAACAEQGFTPYLLHRLDMETSGVLLFGKHERDRQALTAILGNRQTKKTYMALVRGAPHGKVISTKLRARSTGELISAETTYRVLQIFHAPHPLCALVEANISTGRKHQIRQHFAKISHPVIMDSRYGDFHFNRKFRIHYRIGRQFLHAAEISFMHPLLQKQIKIQAPLPRDLQSVLKRLSSR
ncbi:MAG: RluA family pseudouridine synthase [Patescibacteria group bacterium]